MALFDDELRRLQQIKAQNDALAAADAAQQDYSARMAQAQNDITKAQSKSFNPLESVLGGIANSIATAGKGLGDFFTTGAINAYAGTGLKSLFEGKSYAQAAREARQDTDDFKKRYYNTDNLKDAYAKSGGTALDTAATLSDLIPVAGGASKVGKIIGSAGGQIAQGAISGAAQNLIDNGADASLEDTLRGAASGAAGAGVGRLVGGGLAKAAGGNGLMSSVARNNIARGAMTGAASGAAGATTSSALRGGDLGQNLQAALQGAGTGLLGGATMGGIMSAAGALTDKGKQVLKGSNVEQDASSNPSAHRQKAVGWDGEEINASKRNKLQTIGKELQEAGERTKNADVYGRLNNNTARDVDANDTINRLQKEYGYTAKDYDRAANLSEATNKWISNELKSSGASGFDHDLVNRTAVADVVDMTDKQLASYNKTARQLLNDATVSGGGPGEYSAAGLYEASEKAGKLANTYYEKAHNKMDGSVINPALDELSEAYRNLKNQTRAAADTMVGGKIDDITRNNLTKMLQDSGAPDAAVKTLSNAESFSELKRLTAPLEQARSMDKQIHQTMLKRGATTDNSRNPVNVILNKSGATQALDAALSPVGRIVGGAEQVAGKAVTNLGNAIAGDGAIGQAVRAMSNDAAYNTPIGDIVNKQISRQAGISAANAQENEAKQQATRQQMQNIQNDYNNAMTQAQQAYTNAQAMAPTANTDTSRLDQITRAMDLALAAGDLDSYSKLASLYQTAYKIYAPVAETASPASSLNATQQGNLAKLESAGTAINQLEQLYNQAGGAQGRLGGSLAQFGGALGINSGASAYENAARGLINQISAAVGKTDSLNTEGEVQRALDLVPKITDTPEEAQAKLQSLRSMLNANRQTYQSIYGVAQ